MSLPIPEIDTQQSIPSGTIDGNVNDVISYSKYTDILVIGSFGKIVEEAPSVPVQILAVYNDPRPSIGIAGVVLNSKAYPPNIIQINEDNFYPRKKPDVVSVIKKGFVTVNVSSLSNPEPFGEVYIGSSILDSGTATTNELDEKANAIFIREIPQNTSGLTKVWQIQLK